MPKRSPLSIFLAVSIGTLLAIALLFALHGQAPVYGATIIVDGLIDADYGPPLASDPAGDGGGNTNMDLLDLYVAEDSTYFYFAFTVNDDLAATSWGKYAIYIDTSNDRSGATSDAWGRSVLVDEPHEPEYGAYTWVDATPYGPEDTQLWSWTGSGWTEIGQFADAALNTGITSTLEWQIAKSDLGNPDEIWVEVWDTGGGDSDNARDTINHPPDDWNGPVGNWSTTAVLSNTTHYPPTPTLSVTNPPYGGFFGSPYVDVTGVVTPASGTTVTVQHNTTTYTPTLGAGGAFTQPLVLTQGGNDILVRAQHAGGVHSVYRYVTFGAAQDDDVFWDGLYHDSRDPMYRSPSGPVTTGTPITIHFRSYAGDLTGVSLRVWDDVEDTAYVYPMSVVASDAAYDYWEATLPAQAQPTVLWYRFIVVDGSDTDYYEDNHIAGGLYRGYLEGGPGKPYDNSPDLSFQITVYDPAFQTPDWLKQAVVYQIFADRFYDGDPANNVISGSHFMYGDPNGGITYTTWNEQVIDPRDPSNPFYYEWSQDFYGGDLNGIADQLDYLQSLGVTALYLNPIFTSPSNHKYDSTTFEEVDDNFGGNAALDVLLAEADARGMHVILDGVFNHTSSDSIYFDKYSRYSTDGAYESQTSPYFDWYTFSEWPDGYESWWNFDTLPVLRSENPEVRTYFYSGTHPIATRWVLSGTSGWRMDVGGDVDAGLVHEPENDYWEGFRQAVKAADPDAVIIGEEWGDATSWLLGNEWDVVMNYRFRSALLSFMRERYYEDNDNNPNSFGGVLDPITPSQLDAWLHAIQEDYPPEAWAAMMNLLGSHDTNRVRFVLSKDQIADDTAHIPYNPATDFSPQVVDVYQQHLAILQFTLPGAPTVYYADEVGIDARGRWYNDKWEDDPYNRAPFPWEPGYYEYRTPIHDHYTLLAHTRLAHPALQTGDFHTLLTDDEDMIYAYGRRLPAEDDAAIVVLNRDNVTHSVTIDVSGYLGDGTIFTDVLDGGASYFVDGDGLVGPIEIGPMWGALLVLDSGHIDPPPAPQNLQAQEDDGQVTLTWDPATGAAAYTVYRSPLPGGPGSIIADFVLGTTYVDNDVVNSTRYYYQVRAESENGILGAFSNQVAAMPHQSIDWANLQWPPEITHTIGLTPTPSIYGQVWISGTTSAPGQTPGLMAQVGYGPTTTQPISWTEWVDAPYHSDVGNNDQFATTLLPEHTGDFHYVYRYSTTGGRDWLYADLNGPISATSVVSPGLLHVLSSGDTDPPSTPTNLSIIHWGADHLTLEWDPVAAADLYAYDLYRWGEGETMTDAVQVARVPAPTTVYTDSSVMTNHTYTYTVRALDSSFNRSGFSNPASGRAEARLVELNFEVQVPDFTPTDDIIYVAGSDASVFGAEWNPNYQPLTQVTPFHWTITLFAPEDEPLEYKYTRSSWDTVEKWGWLSGYANRVITPTYGTTGSMLISDVVHNWRDPLVVSVSPLPGSTSFEPSDLITATFNRALMPATVDETTVLVNDGAVTGTVGLLTDTIHFDPAYPLDPDAYYEVRLTEGIQEADESIAMQDEFVWSFGRQQLYLPVVLRNAP